jgi:hypothetical protein
VPIHHSQSQPRRPKRRGNETPTVYLHGVSHSSSCNISQSLLSCKPNKPLQEFLRKTHLTSPNMGDVQAIQNAEQFELRNRKRSPGKSDLDTNIIGDKHRASISEPDTEPSYPGNPSSKDFRSLIATNCSIGHIQLSLPSTPEECLFYVKNGSLRRNTPSVVLSHETKEGPIIGTLKLGYSRNNTAGIGDPAKEKDITWENLKRTSQWTYATYEFSFGDQGDRRTYIWQRTKQGFFSDQPNMELREKLMSGGMGETLAIYKGNQQFFHRF